MKRRMLAIALLAIALAVIPMAAFADLYVKTSGGGSVNMRSGPGTDYDVVCRVPFGAKVEARPIYGHGWMPVRYNGQDGYIAPQYLTETKPVKPSGGDSGSGSGSSRSDALDDSIYNNFKSVGMYTTVVPSTPGNFVNMRWAPSKSAPVVAKYFANQSLYIIAENKNWVQVYDTATGNAGFMLKSMTSR